MRSAWRKHLLAKPGAEERFPFDPELPVYFIGKKMFAILFEDGKQSTLNLKCIPDWSLELRREYPAITPGYHMNKKHWNTLLLDGSIPGPLVKKLINCSYDLVAPAKKEKRA